MSVDAQATTREAQQLGQVLLVDDGSVAEEILAAVSRGSRRLTPVVSGHQALDLIKAGGIDTVLISETLADMSGRELLQALRQVEHAATLIVLTDSDPSSTEEIMDLGVSLVMKSPTSGAELIRTVNLTMQIAGLRAENQDLRRRLNGGSAATLVGCSPQSRRLAGVIGRVADGSATVLIEGKPGVGKSLAARAIHELGRRAARRLVSLPCEGVSTGQLETSLEEANEGTLVLEDVEFLPAPAQQRLVKHLKDRSPRTQGGAALDVRLIATTAAHLPELVARGQFREDLFYRLNVFPIHVPSLQERRDDIGLLASHFLNQSAEQTGLANEGFSSAAMVLLETHGWPGNVAQLQSAVFRAHALAKGTQIDRGHLSGPTTGLNLEQEAPAAASPVAPAESEAAVTEQDILPMEVEEKRLLARALKATSGNVRRAAQLLRIGRATLYRKIQVYDLRLN